MKAFFSLHLVFHLSHTVSHTNGGRLRVVMAASQDTECLKAGEARLKSSPTTGMFPTSGVCELPARASGATIEYLAHASFVVRSAAGTEILIDPYASRVWLGYDFPTGVEPDAVLITHPHSDHDAGRFRGLAFPWGPEVRVIDTPGVFEVGDIRVTGVEGKHAGPYGEEFGQLNTMMKIEVGGLSIVHQGDNGPLMPQAIDRLGAVDVLMAPVDSLCHILTEDELQAIRTALTPRLLIPMHYRIPELEIHTDSPHDLGTLNPWLEAQDHVDRVEANVLRLVPENLPKTETVLVLSHSPLIAGSDASSLGG